MKKRFKVSSSHYNLITTRPGLFQPTSCYEALPGETIQQSVAALIRVSPPATPVMHPVTVRIHVWQVPIRNIDATFTDFITGGEDGNDSTTPPRASSVTVSEGDLVEALGIPPGTQSYNRGPVLACAEIWNKRYRDQQLSTEIDLSTYNGNVPCPKIAWEKDRFTSARGDTQLGSAVTLPVGTQAPVMADSAVNNNRDVFNQSDGVVGVANAAGSAVETDGEMYADLSSALALNVNDWRMAFAVQRWQEARNEYGSRWTEYLRACGVKSSDGRLQDPEYLGGGKQIISFSEVLNESDGTGASPLGSFGGHGIAAVRTRPFRRFIEEHSYIITVMSIRPKAMYMNGIHPMWNRTDKMDWFQKELQYVGQEEIYNRELRHNHATPGGVFGYNDRYGSFRHIPSRVSGEFRSTLDSWHMARNFASDPALNATFVECSPTDRVYQDTSTTSDKMWCMVNHNVKKRTPVDPRPRNRII
jgi:hypothetical protein